MAEVRVSPRAEIKRILLADADVTALTGDRIFIGRSTPEQGRIQRAYIELRNVGDIQKTDYYAYAWQRVYVYCVAPTNEQADALDLIIYGILDAIDEDLPLVTCMPAGAYDIDEREFSNQNIVRSGVFRPYRILYIDSYTT